MLFGLSYLDLAVILIYFVFLSIVGVSTYQSVKTTGDYFMGNRRFGKLLMIGHAMGTGTHTDQPVTVAGASYSIGLAGIWYQWAWMFSNPFFWLLSPIYRRLRYITTGDFFEHRYGKNLGAAYAFMGFIYFTMSTGLMLKGTGTTIDAITQGQVPSDWAVVIITILFVTYSLIGGLVAAVITDFIQGVFILILSFLLLPFAINAAGSMRAFHEGLPEYMFSFVAPAEVTLFFILAVVLNSLISIVVQPHHMAVGGAGKHEMACRMGWTYGNFLKRLMTLGWAFVGVFAAFLYPGLTAENREMAFGIAVMNLLPAGLIGLMLASMAAAVMSSCDSFMVGGSALFTRNFYAKYINSNANDKKLMSVARWSSIAIVFGGIGFAMIIPSVVDGLLYIWKFTAFFGVSFWMALFWRRANRYGAWASLISMIICNILTDGHIDWAWDMSLAWQISLYLPVGFIAIIAVSLVTPSENEEKLRQFYLLLDTPVGEEYKLKDAKVDIILEGGNIAQQPRTAPPLKEQGHSLLLVDLLSLHKKFTFKRYRIDLVGFIFACAVVAGIFGIGILAASIGKY